MSILTAAEFVRALADTGHVLAHEVEGRSLGGKRENITRIELQLSNGRCIEIMPEAGADGFVYLLLAEC